MTGRKQWRRANLEHLGNCILVTEGPASRFPQYYWLVNLPFYVFAGASKTMPTSNISKQYLFIFVDLISLFACLALGVLVRKIIQLCEYRLQFIGDLFDQGHACALSGKDSNHELFPVLNVKSEPFEGHDYGIGFLMWYQLSQILSILVRESVEHGSHEFVFLLCFWLRKGIVEGNNSSTVGVGDDDAPKCGEISKVLLKKLGFGVCHEIWLRGGIIIWKIVVGDQDIKWDPQCCFNRFLQLQVRNRILLLEHCPVPGRV